MPTFTRSVSLLIAPLLLVSNSCVRSCCGSKRDNITHIVQDSCFTLPHSISISDLVHSPRGVLWSCHRHRGTCLEAGCNEDNSNGS
ncbi:hypothetical protein K466DRAFT_240360 [Polyporus arcularius HHB13444]|uniref:Cyanovirin-N domain-containing protein n=1 Tax=Polyporus arcularius HHB13444 TaxID=1314778 RepID=A0A5C3P6W3_9APHY|nr:hypothetical protein K466DRAFT_240360 [Polyporus arcularius HHB13444]